MMMTIESLPQISEFGGGGGGFLTTVVSNKAIYTMAFNNTQHGFWRLHVIYS